MDKMNFVRDGESKLPPGFRFQPTDEEIVFQYLARKVFHHPLPASIIPEINIFSFDPWDHLPGDSEQDRYYFSNKEANNYRNVLNRTIIATCAGFWKATGTSDKKIICSKKVPIFGIKKTLVFYKGKQYSRATKTDWIMNVYSIAAPGKNQGSFVQVGNWVLCHVLLKKRSTGRKDEDGYNRMLLEDNYDSMGSDMDSSCDSSSDSCSEYSDSSSLTEVSSCIASGETTSPNV